MSNIADIQSVALETPTRSTSLSTTGLRIKAYWQIVRFALVGVLNSSVDLLLFNILVWRFPTHNTWFLLLYSTIAYLSGTLNSFLWNKYWTFRQRTKTTGAEVLRFAVVNGLSAVVNAVLVWGVATLLHPIVLDPRLWANAAKACAVIGTAIISYLGMRLWVFNSPYQVNRKEDRQLFTSTNLSDEQVPEWSEGLASSNEKQGTKEDASRFLTNYSLSVILPAHNEEAAIEKTVRSVITALAEWVPDYEVIVVNDGSKDRTHAIVEELALSDTHIILIDHTVNQGYGAALVSGFEAVSKDLAFFMDSDGQFDIRDIQGFLPLIDRYDAVLGYRIHRQDHWIRICNAWAWKMLVTFIFGVRIRDVDCAFKLYRAEFFRTHTLETRGAMINTELLYKFTRAGYTYTEVGVHHLHRQGGRATGAKPAVILKAFRELFFYALKWRREERALEQALIPGKESL